MDNVTIVGHDGVFTKSAEAGNTPIIFVFSDSESVEKTEIQITFQKLKTLLCSYFEVPPVFTDLDKKQ